LRFDEKLEPCLFTRLSIRKIFRLKIQFTYIKPDFFVKFLLGCIVFYFF